MELEPLVGTVAYLRHDDDGATTANATAITTANPSWQIESDPVYCFTAEISPDCLDSAVAVAAPLATFLKIGYTPIPSLVSLDSAVIASRRPLPPWPALALP